MSPQRLEWHLENWKNYMHAPSINLGAKISGLYGSGGASGEDEFEVMCEKADAISARSIDACIESLKKPQRVAIYHVWLGSSFFWATHEIDYSDALDSIIGLAEKRGIV